MSEFTDKDIPISCGECGVYCEGVDDTMAHILDKHPNYTTEEAVQYASKWADTAYDEVDLQNQELTAQYRASHRR